MKSYIYYSIIKHRNETMSRCLQNYLEVASQAHRSVLQSPVVHVECDFKCPYACQISFQIKRKSATAASSDPLILPAEPQQPLQKRPASAMCEGPAADPSDDTATTVAKRLKSTSETSGGKIECADNNLKVGHQLIIILALFAYLVSILILYWEY